MTRINVVDPTELCDQHLFAETRELKRIPNMIKSGKARLDLPRPNRYVLGKGHVSFFYDKLKWLRNRYDALYAECHRRGINATYMFPDDLPEYLCNDWTPDENAVKINRERIQLRMPKNARWSNL